MSEHPPGKVRKLNASRNSEAQSRALLTPEDLARRLQVFHQKGEKRGQPNLAYIWRTVRENRWPIEMVIRLPGSNLIRFDPAITDHVLTGGNTLTEGKPRPPVRGARSLKTEKRNGKDGVGSSTERMDLLCL